MTEYLLVTLAVLTAATLIQHLGLAEAVAQVLSKVASCPQCLTFWSVLAVLVCMRCPPVGAALLSILAAYCSNWLLLLLLLLQRLFTRLYDYERKESEGHSRGSDRTIE